MTKKKDNIDKKKKNEEEKEKNENCAEKSLKEGEGERPRRIDIKL